MRVGSQAPSVRTQDSDGALVGKTVQMSASLKVTAVTADKPPVLTAEQAKELETAGSRANGPGPAVESVTTGIKGPAPGTELALPDRAGEEAGNPRPDAPGSYTRLRASILPTSGVLGGFSPVGEPSVTQSGRFVFQTGNWYATRSVDNGATWSYLNPFTIFGSGFCCDQVTIYEPARNRQFWLLQYSNRLVVANSAGNDLVNWIYYAFTPQGLGFPAGATFDFNRMVYSANYIYITTTVRDSADRWIASVIMRLPTDDMVAGASFNYTFWSRNDVFVYTPVLGANGTRMYFGADWYTTIARSGDWFRINWNDETSTTLYWWDRDVDNYAFYTSGANCASTNGVITNWCQRSDSRLNSPGFRWRSSYVNLNLVSFAVNTKQGGGYPFPYTRYIHFREDDLTYFGFDYLWASWSAFLFAALAPNARGDLGGVVAWGGGSPGYNFYPGAAAVVYDRFGFSIDYWLWGSGNACLNGDGLRRFGDYLQVAPLDPARHLWIGSGYRTNSNGGACNVSGTNTAGNVVFGRSRDSASYYRWLP